MNSEEKSGNNTFNSLEYWRNRYAVGQNSGAGSYGEMSQFKAQVLNSFIYRNSIGNCIEFGCGDGNQLDLLKIPKYFGLDVAPGAIDICAKKFLGDKSKSFAVYLPSHFTNNAFFQAELTLSMDVVLHLIEENVYETYMANLFTASTKYVAIFTTATDIQPSKMAIHNFFRDHRSWVSTNAPQFEEIEVALAPEQLKYPEATGFYFYRK
jgi:hypothetical protein